MTPEAEALRASAPDASRILEAGPQPRAAETAGAGARGNPPGRQAPEPSCAPAFRPEGLTSAEADERLRRCGANAIRRIRGKPLPLRFLENFTHLMAILLWAGGLIGFAAGMPQLGIAIWAVNVINGIFSFWQEYRAGKATEALQRLLPAHARVVRDGAERRVRAEELVPGDVIVLSEGDHISADALLVKESELRVDQSTLTGESHPARKSCDAAAYEGLSPAEVPNLVFAGTSVATGTGVAVVRATGMETEFGKIARLTQSVAEEKSPLQKEMIRMTRIVTALATGTGLLFFGMAVALAGMGAADLRALLSAAGLCNNARLVPPDSASGRWSVLGDPTEGALRVAARKGGVDLEAEERRAPRMREIPFDSRRKRMATVHATGEGRLVCVKGAPGEVLGSRAPGSCGTCARSRWTRRRAPGPRPRSTISRAAACAT